MSARSTRIWRVSSLFLKVTPVHVVRQVLSAVEAGLDEVLANDITRQVKAELSDREGIYLNFDPEHPVQAAR